MSSSSSLSSFSLFLFFLILPRLPSFFLVSLSLFFPFRFRLNQSLNCNTDSPSSFFLTTRTGTYDKNQILISILVVMLHLSSFVIDAVFFHLLSILSALVSRSKTEEGRKKGKRKDGRRKEGDRKMKDDQDKEYWNQVYTQNTSQTRVPVSVRPKRWSGSALNIIWRASVCQPPKISSKTTSKFNALRPLTVVHCLSMRTSGTFCQTSRLSGTLRHQFERNVRLSYGWIFSADRRTNAS